EGSSTTRYTKTIIGRLVDSRLVENFCGKWSLRKQDSYYQDIVEPE
ncbi:hypothetical protein RRG08_004987, partial [Elysia crispata]